MWMSRRELLAVEAMTEIALRQQAVGTGIGRTRPLSARSIAEHIGASMSHTESLLSALRRAGLVRAARGRGGGYVLQRDAAAISLHDILRPFSDPDDVGADAPSFPMGPRFRTVPLWEWTAALRRRVFRRVTLADVLARSGNGGAGTPVPAE
jgi:Rrf2 family iron-sulfur cluster assembly transcriptional regulator